MNQDSRIQYIDLHLSGTNHLVSAMSPSSPPHSAATTTTTTTIFLIFITQALFYTSAAAYSCSPPPTTTTKITCPPFTNTPPFPFSIYPGCGHPSFQIQCSSPYSTISINNFTFSVLYYEANSTSLLLSPFQSSSPSLFSTNCSAQHTLPIPTKPISFSGSPFRILDSYCSRLSVLKPCPTQNLPNCSICFWECKLIKNPFHLLKDCGSIRRKPDSQQGCQGDVVGFLGNFLKLGVEVEWDDEKDDYFIRCKACTASGGFCGFNSSDIKKSFLCLQNNLKPHIREKGANSTAMFIIVFLFLCFLIVASVATVILRSRQKRFISDEDPNTVFLRRHRSSSLLPPGFTYEELQSSTNGFDPRRKIGDGGFGAVYLGHLTDGRLVAVKHLHRQSNGSTRAKSVSTKSFCNEILILSSINHPNLVKLYGYCSDPRGLLLVYEYVTNGSLADHLHGTKNSRSQPVLTWSLRVDIALQIAIAVEYLHFSVVPPVVHRDITSSNIFVEKDMRIKVGDFGMSRILVCSDTSMAVKNSSGAVWTGPQGTPGYLDPDYHKSFMLNEKSDIYSFGVVLLELITGMRAVDEKREKREMALADMMVLRIQMGLLQQVVDPMLVLDQEAMDGVCAVAELAFRCVAADKDDRPDAKEVVMELKRIRCRGRLSGGSSILRSSNPSSVVAPES